MSRNGSGFAFFAGALAGAAIGLLFAPKKGEELRQDLKVKGEEVYDKVATYDYSGTKDVLVTRVGDFKTMVSELDREKVKDISLESLDNLKGKAEELVSSAKEELKKNKKTSYTDQSTTSDNGTQIDNFSFDSDEDLFEDL